MSTFNRSVWARLVLFGESPLLFIIKRHHLRRKEGKEGSLDLLDSSAKDQLSGTSVAIKKIMKPFSTPVLSKRTYRELKLLKHLRHENVSDCFGGEVPFKRILTVLDHLT